MDWLDTPDDYPRVEKIRDGACHTAEWWEDEIMAKESDEKCPKDGLPASTHRYHAGVKQLICGNGHNWAEGSGRPSEKAKAADDFEVIRKQLQGYFDVSPFRP